jgi:hypothetical protein
MKPIVTKLFMGIQKNNNAKGKANSQTKDIYQRVPTVSDKYPERNFKETVQHETKCKDNAPL